MIPTGFSYIQEDRPVSYYPTKTYNIDFKNKRVAGTVEGLDAFKQSVTLATSIERYRYGILPDYFGIEVNDLYGKDPNYVCAILEMRIQDALSMYEWVLGIRDFNAQVVDEVNVVVSFSIVTTLGVIEELTAEYENMLLNTY